jgi:erythromycin esterase
VTRDRDALRSNLADLADAADNAREVLHAFERWPTWMWANEEVVALAGWLRRLNDGRPEPQKVGFYGLDVYSLWESLYAILAYLHRVDPSALSAAWRAFRCFEPYAEDVQDYAQAAQPVPNSCANEVVALLHELRRKARRHDADGREGHFAAEHNALVLKNAETYYRTMVRGGAESWNVRDRHMAATLDRLLQHHGPHAKAIVWEHNVIAGRRWEAPMERIRVPPAREGSWEEALHRAGADDKLLLSTTAEPAAELLEPRGHRAIGVVYHPEYEQYGNYVPSVLPRRYDAFLYLDQTHALHPLHEVKAHAEGEVPETYPPGV